MELITFTLEPLFDQTPQHLPAEVTEVGRLVGVNGQVVPFDLQVFHRDLSCNTNTELSISISLST